MIGFLFRNLKGYRFLIVIAITMTLAQVGCDILLGFSIKFISDKIQKNLNPPPLLNGLISPFDRFASPKDLAAISHGGHTTVGVILFSVVMLLTLSALSGLLVYIQLYLASFIAQNLTSKLRNQLFEHLQRLSLDWHGKQKKGDLVQRVTGNIADIEKFVTDGLVDLMASVLTIFGVIAIMLTISPQYTLLSITILPLLFIVILIYTRSIKAATKKASKSAGQVADVATEDINALTVIKVFTREDRENMRFGSYVGKNRAAGLRAGGLQAQYTPLVAIILALSTTIIIGIGGYVAAGNKFSLGAFTITSANGVDIGTLILFLTYVKMLYQPFRDISKLTNLGNTAASAAERIQEVFDQAPEVIDRTTPYYGPTKLRGEITFDNVRFGYTKDRLILKGINLHIPAGRKVALVGLSGGGKTTLVKLIPRFYEIQQGSVKIDGYDNRAIPLATLRQNVSHVLQESVLFEGTIRENIALGRPGANFSEIVEAAKKASIHETIGMLPDGYNTLVREQGKNFSGGQRQRLAIARAILRDAPILVLDEPTAALDV